MPNQMVIANEGDKVVLVLNGKRICDMPPQIAIELSRQLYGKAMLADEFINANRIIMDHAIMQRAGMPIGLSSNPKIIEAARTEAQWNTELRKKMPLKGIEPRAIVGSPTLIKLPRKVSNG